MSKRASKHFDIPISFLAAFLMVSACLLVCFFASLWEVVHLKYSLINAQEDLGRIQMEASRARAGLEPAPAARDTLSAADILSENRIVAHGMGAPEMWDEGSAPLNCLEGFLTQYEAGVRVFEADLRLTRDGKVVLRHDWWPTDWQDGINGAAIPTLDEFLAKPILGRYTPLSFRDLLLLLERYPDVCIITDTKFTDSDVIYIEFDSMLADAQELGLTRLFDRIVIQLYNRVMRQCLENIYPFPHRIHTLYLEGFDQTEDAFRELAAYCSAYGIEGITMNSLWWDASYAPIAREFGINVYVHTVNDPAAALALLESGVNAVYTDLLSPEDLAAGSTDD